MPRYCAEILATGLQCTQFARKGQIWCRAHVDPRLREKNDETRQFIACVGVQDVSGVASALGKIACELRLKLITPVHAEAVLDAIETRLDQLSGTLAAKTCDQVTSANPV
ncbi:MAG: hypothetical protein JOZ83_15260 [Silvibacterium sp.]|nr:hypothetical protein [Silvibacterium sp.]